MNVRVIKKKRRELMQGTIHYYYRHLQQSFGKQECVHANLKLEKKRKRKRVGGKGKNRIWKRNSLGAGKVRRGITSHVRLVYPLPGTLDGEICHRE